MKFNQLRHPTEKKSRRVGRGISAGKGKTAGRGTKGQGARKSPVKVGFEGGQTPLAARIPKLAGFKSRRTKPEVVYTGSLDTIKSIEINSSTLAEAGLISNPHVMVKLISKGEVTKKKTVRLQAASATAIEQINKVGGSYEKIVRLPRPKSQKST